MFILIELMSIIFAIISPCERPPVLGHCRQKLTRSGNDFHIAGPHVRQLHLAVEILNSLPNESGLTLQKIVHVSQLILQKSSYFVPK